MARWPRLSSLPRVKRTDAMGYLAERHRATPSAWDIKQGSSARPLAPPQRTPGGRGHSKGEAQTPGAQPTASRACAERPPRPPISLRLTAQAEVKVSFDFAKGKYKESLQQLIDDFGFHPAFKRWFDEF